MQNYFVHICCAHPVDMGSVSGVIEDIESGQKKSFHSLNGLQAMPAHSIGKGRLEFPNLVSQALITHDNVAVAG